MPSPQRASAQRIALIASMVVLGGLANTATSALNMAISSPFFFDSIFTAVCAALFGPLAGMICGFLSHVFMELFHGWNGQYLPFAACNMATGLIVGLFAQSRRLALPSGAMFCAFLVTLANSVIGAFVAYFVYGGVTNHASDYLVAGFLFVGQSLFAAAFWARIPANLIDKGIALVVAFYVARHSERHRGSWNRT